MTDSDWESEVEDNCVSPTSYRSSRRLRSGRKLAELPEPARRHITDGSPMGDCEGQPLAASERQPLPQQRNSPRRPGAPTAAPLDRYSADSVVDRLGVYRTFEPGQNHSDGALAARDGLQAPVSRTSPVTSPRPRSPLPPPGDPTSRARSPRQAVSHDNLRRTVRVPRETVLAHYRDGSYVDAHGDELRIPRQELVMYRMAPRMDDAYARTRGTRSPNRADSEYQYQSDTEPIIEEPASEKNALTVALAQYQFSQGDAGHLALTDHNPSILMRNYGRLTQRGLMRAWSETFWVLSVPILTLTTFLQTLLRWTLQTIALPVLVAPVQLVGDYLIKPSLVTVHDAVILPVLTLGANTVSSLLLVGRPLSELTHMLVSPLATLLGSIRLVQVNYGSDKDMSKKSQSQVV